MDRKKFTIRELEQFSGIKAHNIRAWESRYGLLKPDRTINNLRLYTLDELKNFLNIALLKKNGFRISGLTPESIEDKIRLLVSEDNLWQKAINDITINMYLEDVESFESVLDKFLLQWPIDTLIEKVLFPFLKITNLLWVGHKLSEEHLVVTACRKKLIRAIESLKSTFKTDKIILLFLPDTKQLDLGLLYTYYFLKRRGVHTLYVGNDVTVQNLKRIVPFHPPTFLFTYLPENHHFPVAELLRCMNMDAPFAKLLIADYHTENAPPVFGEGLIKMGYLDALEFLFESCK
jgi:MerR family transcriptional regulator, light-induced transcriptional regulator